MEEQSQLLSIVCSNRTGMDGDRPMETVSVTRTIQKAALRNNVFLNSKVEKLSLNWLKSVC
jgi:hypothetical protein